MGLLDATAVAGIAERLSGGGDGGGAAPPAPPAAEGSPPAPSPASAPAQGGGAAPPKPGEPAKPPGTEAKPPGGAGTEADETAGHPVPYNRFRGVNEARKAAEGKAAALEAKLTARDAEVADLKKQIGSFRSVFGQPSQAGGSPTAPSSGTPRQPAGQPAKDWLDEMILGTGGGQPAAGAPQDNEALRSALDKVRQEYGGRIDAASKAILARVDALDERLAGFDIDGEIAAAIEEFPDVPERLLLDAVRRDGNADIRAIAEQYHLHVAEIEERAIARHTAAAGGSAPPPGTPGTPAPSAPPRPQGGGGAPSGAAAPGQSEGPPKTIKEGAARARAFLGL